MPILFIQAFHVSCLVLCVLSSLSELSLILLDVNMAGGMLWGISGCAFIDAVLVLRILVLLVELARTGAWSAIVHMATNKHDGNS